MYSTWFKNNTSSENSCEKQTLEIFENIDSILKNYDLTKTNISFVQIYIKSIKNFNLVNKIYRNWIIDAHYPPGSSIIELSTLAEEIVVNLKVNQKNKCSACGTVYQIQCHGCWDHD